MIHWIRLFNSLCRGERTPQKLYVSVHITKDFSTDLASPILITFPTGQRSLTLRRSSRDPKTD